MQVRLNFFEQIGNDEGGKCDRQCYFPSTEGTIAVDEYMGRWVDGTFFPADPKEQLREAIAAGLLSEQIAADTSIHRPDLAESPSHFQE